MDVVEFGGVIAFGREETHPRMALVPDNAQFPDAESAAMVGFKRRWHITSSLRDRFRVNRFPYLIGLPPCHEHEQQPRTRPMQNHKAQFVVEFEPSRLDFCCQ